MDLDAEPADADLDVVWAEVFADDNEREVLARAGERFVRRLDPWTPAPGTTAGAAVVPDAGFALTTTTPGTLDGLRYHRCARRAPGPDEIEIEVVTAGLNFLDVMVALGRIPALESADGLRFGAECAGIV
ncbi:hypothetical protein, partial [Micromonospora sp. NPDC048843]|uniref:hypothetical protein n=1 Tax=Micromonospora sp. NPDC048843 TaxID=3155389 RepID=UPI00340C447F